MNDEELNNVPEQNDNVDNNVQNKYMEILRDFVDGYCVNGLYIVEHDYRDMEVFTEDIGDILNDLDGTKDITDVVTEYVDEAFINGGWYPEDDIFNWVKEEINLQDDDIISYYDSRVDNDEFWNDMEEAGYKGIDYGIDQLLHAMDLDVSIMIAPYNEQNYDMGSIVSSFGTDYLTPDINYIDETYLDNGITYLLHQQGHTVKELYDVLYGGETSSTLVKSVAEEIENNPAEAMSGLTALVHISLQTYSDIMKALHDKSPNIELPQNTQLGIFNSWVGTGSMFDIKLEKPFIILPDYIRSVEVETSNGSYGSYSVKDVYGGIDRDTGVSFTSENPELVDEDLAETLKQVVAEHANSDE